MVKTVFKYIFVIILFALSITAALQAFTKIYSFSPARPFSGDTICNPYVGIDTINWRKANFHAHQRWMLFGMNFDYTAEEFIEAYKEQGYDIIGLADHQQINPYSHTKAYEHGVGLNNYHLLMLGAEEVSWFDYPIMVLPQHQMQYQLDKFKPQVKLLGMNHASRHRHVSVDVFDNLMGYDLMEMNPDLDATAWDRALSNGIHSNLIANDDAHTIFDRQRWYQRCYTMVNTPTLDESDIFESLKTGRAYGVYVSPAQNQKSVPHAGLPIVNKIGLIADTIFVSFDKKADSVYFIGQDARVLEKISPKDSASVAVYKFSQSDTYVRIQAFFPNDIQIWANPFYRQGGSVREPATVNTLLTWVNSVAWAIVALILLWIVFRVLKRKKIDYDSYYRF